MDCNLYKTFGGHLDYITDATWFWSIKVLVVGTFFC